MSASTRRRLPIAIIATAVVVAALSGCTSAGTTAPDDAPIRDDTGQIIDANAQTDAFALQVGDCLNDARANGEVVTVPTVPCDLAHDSEIYSAHELGESSYPGEELVISEAEALCIPAFEQFVGEPYLDSRFDFSYYYPTDASWAGGDREVLCVIYDPEGQITGSLAGVTD